MSERWKHTRTGIIYVLFARGLMKTADSEWISSVIYYSEDQTREQCYYTRDEETFNKNFEPV